MKPRRTFIFCVLLLPALAGAQTALTIYNQDFAVIRDRVPLDLKPGINTVSYADVTARVEPDSVVLRDPAGKVALHILEQSYRADALSPGYLFSLNEGKMLDFLVKDQDNREYIVKGKIIRSGYVPNGEGRSTPIIDVNGQLRFSLPGEPIFPSLGEGTILKPTITWRLEAGASAKLDAELSYSTAGLRWNAAYNLVLPEKGDTFDFVGWLTIENNSGKEFKDALVRLMAGNVNKSQEYRPLPKPKVMNYADGTTGSNSMEKSLDEYHLYTLPRSLTLRDHETKQIDFVQAINVKAKTFYVYDGFSINNLGMSPDQIRFNERYGSQVNNKVWIMREFNNTKENGLGIALPAGRMRFYRRDDADGSLQFVGDNIIDHTPANETLRLYTGDAFDLVGDRKRTDYQMVDRSSTMTEAFEIKVRNHKKEAVEIRVVEHLYRWVNWEIIDKSDEYTKTDAQTVEFRVPLKPDEEKTITYRVRYTWR